MLIKAIAIFGLCGLMTITSSCSQHENKSHQQMEQGDHQYTNKLINETSPYLLEHAHNPVNWYPWGEEALQKAEDENKLLIISVGYAACHWCHVMERESFSDTSVAKLMNEHFVSIKVDREERPDVDQIYMNAAQLLTGRGGWPLNAIALPDGRPVFAGTYFPKENWLSLLNKINTLYQEEPEKLKEQAEAITEGIRSVDAISLNESQPEYNMAEFKSLFDQWEPAIDFKRGGQNRTPKFPLPVSWEFLLYYNYLTGNGRALEAVKVTLEQMAYGGIYDQVGGGFARYSTDQYWKVPHFEKMLYDNGQLVSLYAHAYQATGEPLYKEIVYETLQFVERELTAPGTGFYSSLNADSEGEEGKFYVWASEEIKSLFKEDKAEIIIDYYNIASSGNWEDDKNILHRSKSDQEMAEKYDMSADEFKNFVESANKKILKKRSERIRPSLDDKILTSWNALMLKGYIDAYTAFGDQEFLKTALNNAKFISSNLMAEDYSLKRSFKYDAEGNGEASINGFMDDYALTIQAFIDLYQATFNEKWLTLAKGLTEYTFKHFYDGKSGMFFYTSDLDPGLIARKMEVPDNVIPSSNSVMASNLYKLGEYFYDQEYINKSRTMLNNVKDNIFEGGPYYANWAMLMGYFVAQPYEVAIVGDAAMEKKKEMGKKYLPNALFMGGENEGNLPLLENKLVKGKTMIYVCQNKSCRLPVTEPEKALEQIAGSLPE